MNVTHTTVKDVARVTATARAYGKVRVLFTKEFMQTDMVGNVYVDFTGIQATQLAKAIRRTRARKGIE